MSADSSVIWSLGLDLVTTLAVIVGVIFAVIQLKQASRVRRDHGAIDIVRTVQSPEVRLAMATILKLPDDASAETIREDPRLLEAALVVDSACDMWGCMVYETAVDQHMLDRMVDGWVRGTWRKLRVWIAAERIDGKNPNLGEWWQWLFEKIEANPDPSKESGAHNTYRGMCKYSEGEKMLRPRQSIHPSVRPRAQ